LRYSEQFDQFVALLAECKVFVTVTLGLHSTQYIQKLLVVSFVCYADKMKIKENNFENW